MRSVTGRSQVWLAYDEPLDRNVALKVREFENATSAEIESRRFEDFARLAARIEHPGIIAVYESVHTPGERVTEDLRGQIVGRLARSGDGS